jgi:hypothetical protein
MYKNFLRFKNYLKIIFYKNTGLCLLILRLIKPFSADRAYAMQNCIVYITIYNVKIEIGDII